MQNPLPHVTFNTRGKSLNTLGGCGAGLGFATQYITVMQHNEINAGVFQTVFVGAGPGGSGPLVCAMQQGRLDHLLDMGVAVIDRDDTPARGALGDYIINSDTLSDTFLEPLQHAPARHARLLQTPSREKLERYAGGPAPLSLAGEFMVELGAVLRDALAAHPRSRYLGGVRAIQAQRHANGDFTVLARQSNAQDGQDAPEPKAVRARNLVFAMGATQSLTHILNDPILETVRLAGYAEKVLRSHDVLSAGGVDRIRARLSRVPQPKVVIVGGSHSAISSAWVLLNRSGIDFDEGAIRIAHRGPLRLFYPSAEAALADGYTDFGPDDICPLTKRLYRLAGFRFDSRELVMRMWGMAGRQREKRAQFYDLTANDSAEALCRMFDDATLIIGAMGYRPNTVPIVDDAGRRIHLLADQPGTLPLVNRQCQMLTADGSVLPRAYGIGLASGFLPDGELGGEPSFHGQTNGLWLYQNGVGQIILDKIMADR